VKEHHERLLKQSHRERIHPNTWQQKTVSTPVSNAVEEEKEEEGVFQTVDTGLGKLIPTTVVAKKGNTTKVAIEQPLQLQQQPQQPLQQPPQQILQQPPHKPIEQSSASPHRAPLANNVLNISKQLLVQSSSSKQNQPAAKRIAEATSLLDTGLINQEMFEWWYTNVLPNPTVLEVMDSAVQTMFGPQYPSLSKSNEQDLLLHTLYSRYHVEQTKLQHTYSDIQTNQVNFTRHLQELQLWHQKYLGILNRHQLHGSVLFMSTVVGQISLRYDQQGNYLLHRYSTTITNVVRRFLAKKQVKRM